MTKSVPAPSVELLAGAPRYTMEEDRSLVLTQEIGLCKHLRGVPFVIVDHTINRRACGYVMR